MKSPSILQTPLALLRERIEQIVNRKMKTPKDFEYLSECIFDKLHQHISPTTLKRLWGYLSEPVTPRLSTLNLLAQFVGTDSWEEFTQQQMAGTISETADCKPKESIQTQQRPDGVPHKNYPPHFISAKRVIILTLSVLLAVGACILYIHLHDQSNIITFADPAVKSLCVTHWDTDGDGELSYEEAAQVKDLKDIFVYNTAITSFNELQYFTGLTSIGERAFKGCNNLAFLTLPSSVTWILNDAFQYTALENVTVPGTVKRIDFGAYAWIASLKSIVFEEGVETIGNVQFLGCSNLEEIVFPSTLKGTQFEDFFSFDGDDKLTHIVMPIDAPLSRHAELFAGRDLNHSILFTIPEGSARKYLEKGYYNISDKSALAWMKTEFEAEVASVEALTTAKGIIANTAAKEALQDAITTARAAVDNADSYLDIGKRIAAVKTAARTFLVTATITAGTDITAIIRNPRFDRMDFGWNVEGGTYWQGSCLGFQNSEGQNEYTNGEVHINNFLEAWWKYIPLRDGKFTQTLTNLPAGIYRLEADAIAAWEADETVKVTGVSFFMGNSNKAIATANKKPQHFSVRFENTNTQDVTIGVQWNNTIANRGAVDNFRLIYEGTLTPAP